MGNKNLAVAYNHLLIRQLVQNSNVCIVDEGIHMHACVHGCALSICVCVLCKPGVCAWLFMASSVARRPVSFKDGGCIYRRGRRDRRAVWERDVGQPSGLSMMLHFVLSRILEALRGQTGGEDGVGGVMRMGVGAGFLFFPGSPEAPLHSKPEWIWLLKRYSNLSRFTCVCFITTHDLRVYKGWALQHSPSILFSFQNFIILMTFLLLRQYQFILSVHLFQCNVQFFFLIYLKMFCSNFYREP